MDQLAVIFDGEFHETFFEGKEGVISTDTDIIAGMKLCTSLADDDVSGEGGLSSEEFYAQPFRFGFPTVFGTTDPFLVCHDELCVNGFDLNFG
jgi:hypothetical protein